MSGAVSEVLMGLWLTGSFLPLVVTAKTMAENMDKYLILLHEADNIFVCEGIVNTNEILNLDGDELTLATNTELGHELARRPIKAGDPNS